MTRKLFQTSACFVFLLSIVVPVCSQQLVCKTTALAAAKALPALKYKCDESLDDYDERILARPERRKALDLYVKTLEKLAFADWWKTPVEDLNRCDFRRKAGAFSEAETEKYRGEYLLRLFGNERFRVIATADPCYQKGFNGANVFLLNRVGGKVVAAQIIDGFFTRADLPLSVGFGENGREPLIEIATTSGGLSPTATNYYLTIDEKTSRAIPKNLFKIDGRMTHRITSMMLLDEPEEYGLPPQSTELQIIKDGRLSPSFDVFNDSGATTGPENHPKFTKTTLRWNGKFYE